MPPLKMRDQIRGKTRNLARDLEPARWAIGFFRSPLIFSLFSRGASPKWGRRMEEGEEEGAEMWRVKMMEIGGCLGVRLYRSYQVMIFQAKSP